MGLLSRPFLLVLFVLGCDRTLRPQPAVDAKLTPLELARTRALPERVQGKFSFTVRSEANDFSASSGGVVILDRDPERPRGHVAVLGPLGGPLATLQSSEGGVSVVLARQRQHLLASEAESVMRDLTEGLVGIDDLLGLFVGALPLEGATVLDQRMKEGAQEVVLDGPDEATLIVELDATNGTPRHLLARDADGKVMLEARYGPFELHGLTRAGSKASGPSSRDAKEPVGWLPTDLWLVLPGLDLDLELHMKSWTVPDPLPEVFGLQAPEGFSSAPLEGVLRRWSEQFSPPPSDRMGAEGPDGEGG